MTGVIHVRRGTFLDFNFLLFVFELRDLCLCKSCSEQHNPLILITLNTISGALCLEVVKD